ncbi:hypothetical protein KBZ10_28105 [Streptomyces sp. F63]|uniref:hypothetical protein n=1 Tax=Streptomyces sp. F63 TaxID=2824887 RepID=UPI001B36E0FA|nr:hypothetical protein [Streptomyces sp. F63]MBQ0988301.1 hypothetical protein [Streptomyces sp. F63]
MSQSGQGNEPQRHAYEGIVLPSGGGEPLVPEQHATPPAGQPWGQPWGPERQREHQPQQEQPPQQEPPQRPHYEPQPPHYEPQPPRYEPQQYEPQPDREPLPPAAGPIPLPAEETQMLPPQAPAPADAEATQLISPMAGGPLPPERPAESTTFLGRRPGGPAPLPPENGTDEQATQYLAPVPGDGPAPGPPPGTAPVPPAPGRAPFGVRPGSPGDRQPPAEFDGLFRDSRAAETPDATQQMPRIDEQPPPPPSQPQYGQHQYGQQQYGQPTAPHPGEPPQGRAARRNAERKRPLSPVALAGIVIGGCVVAGLAAGAALSGGGDQSGEDDDKKPVAASQSAGTEPSPAADPVREQAEALDALLADSNNSRDAVIKAVQNIGACKNLPKAASDLRDAAKQRNDLVTRLGRISVDRLPGHASLTASLTSAWKASAAADNHYAAWADQVASGKGGCKGGKAKVTGQTAKGNTASGRATEAKKKAAALWNPIAKEHGLTERQYLQL